jgi:hypothetical protein
MLSRVQARLGVDNAAGGTACNQCGLRTLPGRAKLSDGMTAVCASHGDESTASAASQYPLHVADAPEIQQIAGHLLGRTDRVSD